MFTDKRSHVLVFNWNTVLNVYSKRKIYNFNIASDIVDQFKGHRGIVLLSRPEEVGHKILMHQDPIWKINLLNGKGLGKSPEYAQKITPRVLRFVPKPEKGCLIFNKAYKRGVEFYEEFFSLLVDNEHEAKVQGVGGYLDMQEVCEEAKKGGALHFVYRKSEAWYGQNRMIADSVRGMKASSVIYMAHPDEMMDYYRNEPFIFSRDYIGKNREALRMLSSNVKGCDIYLCSSCNNAISGILGGDEVENRIDSVLKLENASLPKLEDCKLPKDKAVRKAFLEAQKNSPKEETKSSRGLVIQININTLMPLQSVEGKEGFATRNEIDGKLLKNLLNFAHEEGHVLIFPSCAFIGANLENKVPHDTRIPVDKVRRVTITPENYKKMYRKGERALHRKLQRVAHSLSIPAPKFTAIDSEEGCNSSAELIRAETANGEHRIQAMVKGLGKEPNETFIATHMAKMLGAVAVVRLSSPGEIENFAKYRRGQTIRENAVLAAQRNVRLAQTLGQEGIGFYLSTPLMQNLRMIRQDNIAQQAFNLVKV